VVTWAVILSSRAVKDAKKLKAAGLKNQTEKLLRLLEHDPFTTPPRFEKLGRERRYPETSVAAVEGPGPLG
jgi:Txe/YoeB family toxin of Txe-Axe toxin-antitoxin module